MGSRGGLDEVNGGGREGDICNTFKNKYIFKFFKIAKITKNNNNTSQNKIYKWPIYTKDAQHK